MIVTVRLFKTIFGGVDINEIAKKLGIERNGQTTDLNTKVTFTREDVEGHTIIKMEVGI